MELAVELRVLKDLNLLLKVNAVLAAVNANTVSGFRAGIEQNPGYFNDTARYFPAGELHVKAVDIINRTIALAEYSSLLIRPGIDAAIEYIMAAMQIEEHEIDRNGGQSVRDGQEDQVA